MSKAQAYWWHTIRAQVQGFKPMTAGQFLRLTKEIAK